MKTRFSLLILSLIAGKAAAFQSRMPDSQPAQASATENLLENQFYGFHAMATQAVNTQSCAAVAVPGCQCPFCTQLRNAGTVK